MVIPSLVLSTRRTSVTSRFQPFARRSRKSTRTWALTSKSSGQWSSRTAPTSWTIRSFYLFFFNHGPLLLFTDRDFNIRFELNMYLDTILESIFTDAGSRKIVLSCFHPDVCTMLRLKQNKYPVLFLTQVFIFSQPHKLSQQSLWQSSPWSISAYLIYTFTPDISNKSINR